MDAAIPWILIAIVSALIVTLAVVALFRKSFRTGRETNHKTFFLMGLIWIMFGTGYNLYDAIRTVYWEETQYFDFSFNVLLILGVVFFIMGAANWRKWKDTNPLTKAEKIGIVLLALGIAVALALTWMVAANILIL